MMTYECGGCPTVTGTAYEFPVYYRINANPLAFDSSTGYPLVTDMGIQPTSSPYSIHHMITSRWTERHDCSELRDVVAGVYQSGARSS